MKTFDLTPSPQLLEVLGDIPLPPWACIAELIDNSFDDFMSRVGERSEAQPTVAVVLPEKGGSNLEVWDNGDGMEEVQFEASLRAGYSGKAKHGHLGLFGMGFNIATARLGSVTTVRTARVSDTDWTQVTIDFKKLQEQQSFTVPVEHVPKNHEADHGTHISVELKNEFRETLWRKPNVREVRERLGDVYSFLLRKEIPGISDSTLNGDLGFKLLVNEEAVEPRLPCIWSEKRATRFRSDQVSAVQKIDRKLVDAFVCLDCGHWEKRPEPTECANCGGENLELRERRVWGWLGVQRFLDTQDFGIDFLRNGRKILLRDKSMFIYESDTGDSEIEYPIEMPSNRGRLVGEIHLDHARVTYQKNDFERQTNDWFDAREIIRGELPLKAKRIKGAEENTSPLATLYGAFRRNDGGLKRLTPGDGDKAIFNKSREWGQQFFAGNSQYYTDEEWFQAARFHDEVKQGKREVPGPDPGDEGAGDTSGDRVTEIFGAGSGPDAAVQEPNGSEKETKSETDEERFARFRSMGKKRQDLSEQLVLPSGLGTWDLTVWETESTLNEEAQPARVAESRVIRGSELEVFVSTSHPLFRECGREVGDYAVIEAAHRITAADGSSEMEAIDVAALIFLAMPDQQFTVASISERVRSLLSQIRERIGYEIAQSPDRFWEGLQQDYRVSAQELAAHLNPKIDWEASIRDGGFSTFLSFGAVADLLGNFPGELLDGHVFRAGWKTWPADEVRARVVSNIADKLRILDGFLESESAVSIEELQIVNLVAGAVEEQLVEND
jgi:hypothetical protein